MTAEQSQNPFKGTENISYSNADSLDHFVQGAFSGVILGLTASIASICITADPSSIYESALQMAGFYQPVIRDNYHHSIVIKLIGDMAMGGITGLVFFSPGYKSGGEDE